MASERIFIDLTEDSPSAVNRTICSRPPVSPQTPNPRQVSSQPTPEYGVQARLVSEPRNRTVPPPNQSLPPVRSLRLPGMSPISSAPREELPIRSLRLPGMPSIPSPPREEPPMDPRRLGRREVALRGTKRSRPIEVEEEEIEVEHEEKRIRSWVPPSTVNISQRLKRARTQNFEIVEREDLSEEEGSPCHVVSLEGSKGQIYEVKVGKIPECSCPDFLDGFRCKHLLYLLESVYKAPMSLLVQDAFLDSELKAMFNQSPIDEDFDFGSAQVERRPVRGECPICTVELENTPPDQIVWCKISCGNNLHKKCWENWEDVKMEQYGPGAEVPCVICRKSWPESARARKLARSKQSRAVPTPRQALHQSGNEAIIRALPHWWESAPSMSQSQWTPSTTRRW